MKNRIFKASKLSLLSLSLLATSSQLAQAEINEPNPITNTPRIVGGGDANYNERTYQVSIQENSSHYCGGALIADDWVLTAAHCIFEGVKVTVLVGTANRHSNKDSQVFSPIQTIIHPNYRYATGGYDIALIKLDGTPNLQLERLSLPTTEVMNTVGSAGNITTVSGWGKLSEENNVRPDLLQEVDVPLVSNSTCNATVGDINNTMICAGFAEGGKDSCVDDSGGSMVADHMGKTYSIGIVSWGRGCARPNLYGVYARTHTFVDWVESYIGSERSF